MAMNTRQKRMSAINVGSPWRGTMVDEAETGFNVGNRAAAAYFYAGLDFSVTPASTRTKLYRRGFSGGLPASRWKGVSS